MRPTIQLLGVAVSAATILGMFVQGCSANGSSGGYDGTGGAAGSGSEAGPDGQMLGCNSCSGDTFLPCDSNGMPLPEVNCWPQMCVTSLGCRDCQPGANTCLGNEVHECGLDGTPGALVQTCDLAAGQICSGGKCGTECELVGDSPSNMGCEFWAVDLPNTRGVDDAASDPWGVVLTNAGKATATAVIEINKAPPGQALDLEVVQTVEIPPGMLTQVTLPMREVTGYYPNYPDPPGPPMTQLSSHAFRIRSSSPLIAYQFNVFTNSYSNDASLLMPRNGLGKIYRVLGFPTANPKQLEMPGVPWIKGIPDHNCVTVVGVEPGTSVSVKVAHDIMGDGAGIPAAKAGDTVTATLGPFDVLNLCSYCEKMLCTGDMTGTIVMSSQPVAVFTSGERIIAPFTQDFPQPPGGVENNCCTDHLEEQVFPVTALGLQTLITRSPPRGSGWVEPDIIRFMGVATASHVKTNMQPPWNEFDIQPGQMIEGWAYTDTIVEATEPIIAGQILVSQGYTEDVIGDPALTFFPSVEQFRQDYVFLVPPSWTVNYFVLASETGNTISFDDGPMPGGCVTTPAGSIGGKSYESIRCEVPEGAHKVAGDKPFGITVYGYGPAGSYAYSGGANVREIYEPPPLK